MRNRDARALLHEAALGSIQGFGLSAGLLALARLPGTGFAELWPLVLVAAVVGALPLHTRRLGPLTLALPVVLLAQQLGGWPLATACAATARLSETRRRHRHVPLPPSRWTYALASTSLATAAASAAWVIMTDVRFRGEVTALGTGVAFAIVHAGTDGLLAWVRRRRSRVRVPFASSRLAARAVEASLALVALPFLTRAHDLAGSPYWIWGVLAALVAFGAGRALGSRPAWRPSSRESGHEVHEAIARALAHSLVVHDGDLRRQLERVRDLCAALARRVGLREDERRALDLAATLHDVGKIAIPRRIRNKNAPLDDDERRRVRVHPGVGAEIVSAIDFPAGVRTAIRHHHERWDGTGYPHGLEGEEIPPVARILAIVDCFVALTGDRPHRPALDVGAALDHLRARSGRAFDPTLVDALVDHVESETWPPGRTERRDPGTDDAARDGHRPVSLSDHEGLLAAIDAMERGAALDVDPREKLALLAATLGPWLAHRSLVVYGLDARDELVPWFASGVAADELATFRLSASPARLAGCALAERTVVTCSAPSRLEPATDDEPIHDLDGVAGSPALRTLTSGLAAPLMRGDRALGVLALYDDDERRFVEADRRRLAMLCGPFASVAAGLDARGPLSRLPRTLTDPLTGLPNARYLRVFATRADAGATGRPVGLIALEFEGLEALQADSGADACRRALVEISRRLALRTRPSETPARIGFSTFVVVTPRHEPAELVRRWRELVRRLEERPISRADGEPVPVRVSAAHATWPADGDSLEAVCDALARRLAGSRPGDRTVVAFERPAARGA